MQKFNDSSRKIPARMLALLLISVYSITMANAQQTGNANQTTIINAARILDVKSGKYLNDYGVLVVDGRIRQIAPRSELAQNAPRGAKVVNLLNATLLPGLIDAHTHLLDERLLMQEFYDNNAVRITQRSPEERMALGERNAREMVEAGWTTVRDLGMAKDCDALKLRDRINAGQTIGPRMFVACKLLTPPGGLLLRPASEYAEEMIRNEYFEIRTEEDARRAVGENVQAGADVIKVVVADEERMLTLPQVRAIVEAAHQANLKVAGHAHTAEAAQIAVDGGVDSVEHAFQVRDETLRQMRGRGIFLVPTVFINRRRQRAFRQNAAAGFRAASRH
ncbi:MAG TPA: amidohydrolase family protein [Pyrinomonadaceae bacterium]|nr:amidohydrolase family protein [Pyrinomonadaceae bacterium]